ISIVSLASVSLLASVLKPTTIAATLTTYQWLLLAFVPTFCGACVPGLNLGNPLAVWVKLRLFVSSGWSLADALQIELVGYFVYHGLVAGVCCIIAIRRLRQAAVMKDVPVPLEERRIPVANRTAAFDERNNPLLLDTRPILWREQPLAVDWNWKRLSAVLS